MGEGRLEKISFLKIWSMNRSRGLIIHDIEKEEKFYETLKPLLQGL
jgi:hypothetical protein